MATGSLTAHPGKYLEGDYSFASISNATNPVGKGANNTTYAKITLKTGTSAETWVYWPFDLSAIPSNATIDSVSCSAKADVSVGIGSHITSRTIQLYSGTTGKGSATNLTTSETAHNLDCGTWTRAELQDCRLRTYARRGASSTSTNSYLYFYGADLTVTYTYQSEKFMLKLSGAYNDVARTFKKVSGIWVEQTDLANVIEDGVRYQNGGEYVPTYKTITVTGSGDAIYNGQTYTVAGLEINGEKISSAGSYQVDPGTVVDFWATPFHYAYGTGTITLNGNSVGQSGDNNSVSYQHTVTENLAVKLSVTGSSISSVGHIDITTE